MRDLLERKLNGVILGIRIKTKELTDAMPLIEKLKKINSDIAAEYENKLHAALIARK